MEPARQGRDDDVVVIGMVAPSCVPQWSPPVRGGTTAVNVRRDDPPALAAMEPARQGRDDAMGLGTTGTPVKMPQWSPPVRGGTTSLNPASLSAHLVAAMEPARQGRDDRHQVRPDRPGGQPAAMEPARQGRDDTASPVESFQRSGPQWSPPVRGGTPRGKHRPDGRDRAAMEPARQGRDDGHPQN